VCKVRPNGRTLKIITLFRNFAFEMFLLLWEESMTEYQREEIQRFRLSGKSYTQISDMLKISRNTVKSVCKRYDFQPAADPTALLDQEHCRNCGTRIVQEEGHKHRDFCSTACRRAWWKAHRTFGTKKTAIQVLCASCGSIFEDYTRNHRKYCCHSCYIQDRFKKEGSRDERAV